MSEFRKLFFKLCIVAFPAFFMVTAELFFLPPTFFTFRCWEALMVKGRRPGLDSWFYPLQKVETWDERGDLGRTTPHSVPKHVVWLTDKYGMRNTPRDDLSSLDLFIVGDSNGVGSSVSQNDILSEVMTRSHNIQSYIYGPALFPEYYSDGRYEKVRPPYVAYVKVERDIPSITPIEGSIPVTAYAKPQYPLSLLVLIDKFQNLNIINYLKARFQDGRWKPKKPDPEYAMRKEMTFYGGDGAEIPPDDKLIDRVTDALLTYKKSAKERNQKFIFIPVPNKETIYYEQLPSKRESKFLEKLISGLQDRGVLVIDTLALFKKHKSFHPEELLYELDDTHWNAKGTRLTADRLNELIKEQDNKSARIQKAGNDI
ncbi:MAG: hypothetical protein HQK54_04835 [Oligoflexales bacterium]|nr:hypothetical protein [Oligoflexales bacterium]